MYMLYMIEREPRRLDDYSVVCTDVEPYVTRLYT